MSSSAVESPETLLPVAPEFLQKQLLSLFDYTFTGFVNVCLGYIQPGPEGSLDSIEPLMSTSLNRNPTN